MYERRGWHRLVPHLAALLVYTVLAGVATWPLLQHMPTHLPAVPNELSQDVWQNIWNVWWVKQALLVHQTNPYQTHVLFYPQGASLLLHTLNLPLSLPGVPLLPLVGVVATYNLLTLLVLVLVGYGTWLLARHVAAHDAAALVAGAVVLLAPQRLNELRLAQLPTISDYGVPLALLGVLLAVERRTWGMALVAAAALLLAGLSSWYHLFHLGIVLAVVLVWQLASDSRRSPLDKAQLRSVLVAWGRVAVFAVVLLAPFLLPAALEAATAPYARKEGTLVSSADVLQLVPGTGNALVSLVPLLLALVGVVLAPRRAGLWAAVGGVCLLLSLGPRLLFGGNDTGIPLPYALFRALPVVDTFRAPLRLNAVVMLMIALVGAVGLAVLARRVPRWGAWGGALVLVALVALETVRLPFPLVSGAVSPFYRQIAQEAGQWSVLELPIDRPDRLLLEMYAQTHHGHYILTGQTSRSVPRLPYEAAAPIAQAERADPREDIVRMAPAEREQFLRGLRVRYLIIHNDPRRPVRADHQAAVARQTLGPLTSVYADEQLQAYRLDDVAAWLDGPGQTQQVAPPLFVGLDMQWESPEPGPYGLARWLPPEGAGVRTYSARPRRVVLDLMLYSLPGAAPLEIWLNGQHALTLPIAEGMTPRRYLSPPLRLPAGPGYLELRAPQGGTSLRALGLGDDTRSLSFSIHHIALREVAW